MRPLITLVLVAFVCSTTAAHSQSQSNAPPPDGPTLLIANKTANTLSFVDAERLAIEGTTTTGQGPHEVAITPEGRWAFVANYEGPGDSISRIDLTQQEETERISIDPYRQPHGLQVHPDGTTLYATVEGNQAVIEVDVATGEVLRAFRTEQQVSHMLVLAPDAQTLYVSSIGSGTVTVIDVASGTVRHQIPTGAGAEGIDVTPDGREVWVTNRAAGTVSIIDAAADTVAATLDAPGFPIRAKITPDGRYALVSRATANAVRVFDVATRSVVKDIDVGAVPVGILIPPNGQRAFVANTRANTVTVLDLETLEVSARLDDFETPDGMAYVPAEAEQD